MNQILKEEALSHGDRLQFIKAEHLQDLKRDIWDFKNSEELNGFQQWIVEELYSFDIPKTEFAICEDRFLIDNQRCLSCLNESGGEFPEWLLEDVHHTLYDCMRCQEKCPLNKAVNLDSTGTFYFTEEETELLLAGNGPEVFSQEFQLMADKIGLFDWPEGLPRNIRAIIHSSK